MAANQSAAVGFKKQSQFKEIWRRFKKNRSAMFGLIVFCIILLLIICAPLFGSYKECISLNIMEKLQPPSAKHIFGTDQYGRDLFLRIVHGGRYSLIIGLTTSLLSMLFGCILGSIAGYFGGKTDDVIMRIMDVFSAIPTIMLALAIISALGSSVYF